MNCGERIRQLRIERGLTQGQLAIKMGYGNGSSIARVETGVHRPSYKVAEKYAKALDCTPEYILWGNENVDDIVAQYYSTFEDAEKELSFIDKLAQVLSEDDVLGKYELSEDQLNSIIQYARFIVANK